MKSSLTKQIDYDFQRHNFQHASARFTIAAIQLEGPLPNGKRVAVVNDRDTFAWSSKEEMSSRRTKAVAIVKAILERHPNTNLIVFPEYSLPVVFSIAELQVLATDHEVVIIGGADNVSTPSGDVLNRAPILLPHHKDPIWVSKRLLSKWEQGYVDAPTKAEIPIFTWSADGAEYWLSVFICLDLHLGMRVALPDGPGLVVVPMCSPDNRTMRTWADALLRTETGTAVVLCNAIGDFAVGGTAVMAVTAGGASFEPAVELSQTREQVAVVEFNCDSLAPTRKTVPGAPEPLGRKHLYDITSAGDNVTLTTFHTRDTSRSYRAVINPAVFDLYGKKLRIAFLDTDRFTEVTSSVKNEPFETLAILGHHDLVVSHLHENFYNLVYDLHRVMPLLAPDGTTLAPGVAVSTQLSETFSYFEVDVFHKVLGQPVAEEDRRVFERPDAQFPTAEEVNYLLGLGRDWSDPAITDAFREKCLKRRWALASTRSEPGHIDALMTIFLQYAGDVANPLYTFERSVLPRLVAKNKVTSVYAGAGRRLSVHYVARITSTKDELFALIQEVHGWAAEAQILMITSTYVVVERLSTLDLQLACRPPGLTPEAAFFWNRSVLPRLDAESREFARTLPGQKQAETVEQYRRLKTAFGELESLPWFRASRDELETKAATGLVRNERSLLKPPHDALLTQVERILQEVIRQSVTEADLDRWRQRLNVDRSRTTEKLSYTDAIKTVMEAVTECKCASIEASDVENLLETTPIRNHFAHNRFDQVTVEAFVNACVKYSTFLKATARAD